MTPENQYPTDDTDITDKLYKSAGTGAKLGAVAGGAVGIFTGAAGGLVAGAIPAVVATATVALVGIGAAAALSMTGILWPMFVAAAIVGGGILAAGAAIGSLAGAGLNAAGGAAGGALAGGAIGGTFHGIKKLFQSGLNYATGENKKPVTPSLQELREQTALSQAQLLETQEYKRQFDLARKEATARQELRAAEQLKVARTDAPDNNAEKITAAASVPTPTVSL